MRLYSERLGRRRLFRALMELGVCSRKEALRRIGDGRVAVDGRVERRALAWVDLRRCRLSVDAAPVGLDPERIVLALHKPRGYVTTRTDPGGRATIYELLPGGHPWVLPVGRLDRDTSGLLILTNDRRLAERIRDPSAHVPKTYHARVAGVPSPEAIGILCRGVTLDRGEETRPAAARVLGATREGGAWVELVLSEGRYRQVRRMLAAVGHDVQDLVRVRIGSLDLGHLDVGAVRPLAREDIDRLVSRRAVCSRNAAPSPPG